MVSVGNLPPKSDVLIKITYVAELSLEDDRISFLLTGSVAPWVKDKALATCMQVVVFFSNLLLYFFFVNKSLKKVSIYRMSLKQSQLIHLGNIYLKFHFYFWLCFRISE